MERYKNIGTISQINAYQTLNLTNAEPRYVCNPIVDVLFVPIADVGNKKLSDGVT